jgi:uncharacterized membrane protein HdeD (DUF308 family)
VWPAGGVAAHWFLAAGGLWSIFLAVLILSLPYALTDQLVDAIGVYVLVFGVLVSVAAFSLRKVVPPVLLRRAKHTWTTR